MKLPMQHEAWLERGEGISPVHATIDQELFQIFNFKVEFTR
jgi:hypothetical protein